MKHKLPEKLAALEKFKDQMTIIQSLSGVGFRGNHTKGFGTLSLHDSENIAIAPTLDCLLGQHLSTGPYPMYGMAMNGRLLERMEAGRFLLLSQPLRLWRRQASRLSGLTSQGVLRAFQCRGGKSTAVEKENRVERQPHGLLGQRCATRGETTVGR